MPTTDQRAEGCFLQLIWILHHVAWHLDVSKQTLVDGNNFICNVCCDEDSRRNQVQLGGININGQPIVVDIDESYLILPSKVPPREGTDSECSGLSREREWPMLAASGALPNCTVTLLAIIQQWRLSGTHIMSDGWAAYNNVAQINGGVYLHDVVVHQHNFVDTNNADIHTQNIDNLWMRAKRKLRRQFGTTRALFDTYLEESM